jgi:shikimate kinase
VDSPNPTASTPRTSPFTGSRAGGEPFNPQRIVLIGFMGSGKSTVGPLLAQVLGWAFFDLDNLIEQRTGLSVPRIFAEKGEAAFRAEESAALASALLPSNTVLALGGGAPETPANHALLHAAPATLIAFLDAPFDALEDRCQRQSDAGQATFRPVLADRDAAQARFHTRHPIYRGLAHIHLSTEAQSPRQTTAALLAALRTHAAAPPAGLPTPP